MAQENIQKKTAGDDEYNEYFNSTFHPHNVLLTLVLFGVTALFLAFSAAFVYTRVQADLPPLQIPPIFIFNTLVLVGSSLTMMWAHRCYLSDQTERYQLALASTIGLTILFMVLQWVGWMQLQASGLWLGEYGSIDYLCIISFLHFAHVLAGLPFLVLFLIAARRKMKEPVSVLVYFSDPEKQLKLRLLTRYWHFLDLLWIYLVLFFGAMWLFG